jgi:ABC-type transporter Mla subunit MlaD
MDPETLNLVLPGIYGAGGTAIGGGLLYWAARDRFRQLFATKEDVAAVRQIVDANAQRINEHSVQIGAVVIKVERAEERLGNALGRLDRMVDRFDKAIEAQAETMGQLKVLTKQLGKTTDG